MSDDLGDRMKQYESMEGGRRFMPLLPIIARIDGRAFHSFCRGLSKPFDRGFHSMMADTLRYLVFQTGAVVGYTQSDEISLLWYSNDVDSQVFFDGKIHKLVSITAALATVRFNRMLPVYLPSKKDINAVFDCRAWTVPTKMEAVNAFLWREQDATRNSINAAGQAHFSHKQLQGKNTKEVQEMLHAHGVNWNDYPAWAKRGTWIRKVSVVRPFTAAELEVLPPKHEARRNPDLVVERWDLQEVDMPKFGAIENRVEVLFDGAAPVIKGATT